MGAPQPKFIDVFADDYGDFIRVVRKNVVEDCSSGADPEHPVIVRVLPPEKKIPRLRFHVILYTTTSTITLAVRMDNLYLVGFQTPAGVWWEFNNKENTHLIADATWIGFSGHYQDLVGQKGLETVTLGRADMTAAVDLLASHGTTAASVAPEQALTVDPYARPKSMLAKLVIMVCEGLRFHTVYTKVDKEFKEVTGGAKLTELEGRQVNRWDRISKAVLGWTVDPNEPFPIVEEVGVMDINDAVRSSRSSRMQLASRLCLALLLCSAHPR